MAAGINFDRENIGKFILRVSLGIFFVIKGINFFVNHKIFCESSGTVSMALSTIGLPKFSVTVLAIFCISCGLCLTIGFCNRAAAFLLTIIMTAETIILYSLKHIIIDDVSYSALITISLLSYVLFGAGKFSIDKK